MVLGFDLARAQRASSVVGRHAMKGWVSQQVLDRSLSYIHHVFTDLTSVTASLRLNNKCIAWNLS